LGEVEAEVYDEERRQNIKIPRNYGYRSGPGAAVARLDARKTAG